MSATSPSETQAANDTLAALERYRTHVTQLTGRWLDAELYHTVAQDLDAVRRCCRALPRLSGPWVALLIAHAELVHGLWQVSREVSPARTPEHDRLLARVQVSVEALTATCMNLAAPGR